MQTEIQKLINVLEFDRILNRLSEFAVSDIGKRLIMQTEPVFEYSEVSKNLALTNEAYTVKYKYLINPICEFDDITEILGKAKAGAVLRPGELLKTAGVLRAGRIAKTSLSDAGDGTEGLKAIVGPMVPDKSLENLINKAIAGENEIKDDASERLYELRRKIHSANAKLKEKLSNYTRASNISKYLQDNIVTVRMGRFVLPVKSECRSMVPGLIHDQSSTGSTVFIEPFPVVELNNELKYLQMEEVREIERILMQLSEYVAQSYDYIKFTLDTCALLDTVFAKAAYSESFNGTMPVTNKNGCISLKNAKHPLIDANKVVPVSIETGKDYNMLVITGPNTGGKTVCLKVVGLCCLMAYCGIMIPCDKNSVIGVYDGIYCDLGDEQSIEQSLSTFSAHIVNIVKITECVTSKSLVLLDELGSGTDPVEGAALSVGIVKFLETVGCKGIITTHFNELKEYALVSDKLKNACMQFNEDTLKPTYKLMVGIPGVSNALKIAGTLGLNDYILQKSKESISPEDRRFEEVLRLAQDAKTQAENQKEELERERAILQSERQELELTRKRVEERKDRLTNNAKAEAREIISNIVYKANELLSELKETVKEQNEEGIRKARILLSKIEQAEAEAENDIKPVYAKFNPQTAKPGQSVIIKSIDSIGELIALADKKGEYSVKAGNVTLKVKANDLAAAPLKQENSQHKKQNFSKMNFQTSQSEPTYCEVKLLGMTVSEGIEALEPHILSAQTGSILRIVHGKGTGALGKGIQAYLKTCPKIASFRYGRYGEGDLGVTIAEIK